MVRTRSSVGGEEGDIDWAKFLYDDVGQLTAEEVSIIPKNIVSERRKRLENLINNNQEDHEQEQGTTTTTPCSSSADFVFFGTGNNAVSTIVSQN